MTKSEAGASGRSSSLKFDKDHIFAGPAKKEGSGPSSPGCAEGNRLLKTVYGPVFDRDRVPSTSILGLSMPDLWSLSARHHLFNRMGIFSEDAGSVDCSRAPRFTRGASRGIGESVEREGFAEEALKRQ